MSIRIMSRVWEKSEAKGSALLVLLAIADFADDQGQAYPSVSTLGKKARMSDRNVRYVLDELVKSGELTIRRNEGPKGCNLFRIPERFAGGVQSVQGATAFREGVQPPSGGAATAIAAEPSLTVREPSRQRRRKRERLQDGRFDRFYEAYPHHVGRVEAEEAWAAIAPDDLLAERICRAAAQYAAKVRREGTLPKHIKHPSGWLNARRWEDQLPLAQVAPGERDSDGDIRVAV